MSNQPNQQQKQTKLCISSGHDHSHSTAIGRVERTVSSQ